VRKKRDAAELETTVRDRQSSVTEPEQKALYPCRAGLLALQEVCDEGRTNHPLDMSHQQFCGNP